MFQHSWSQLSISHKQFYFSYSYNWTRQLPAAYTRFSHMLQCLEHSSVQQRSCICPLFLTSAFDYLTITICNNIHILIALQRTEKFQDLSRRKHRFFQGRIDRGENPSLTASAQPFALGKRGSKATSAIWAAQTQLFSGGSLFLQLQADVCSGSSTYKLSGFP